MSSSSLRIAPRVAGDGRRANTQRPASTHMPSLPPIPEMSPDEWQCCVIEYSKRLPLFALAVCPLFVISAVQGGVEAFSCLFADFVVICVLHWLCFVGASHDTYDAAVLAMIAVLTMVPVLFDSHLGLCNAVIADTYLLLFFGFNRVCDTRSL